MILIDFNSVAINVITAAKIPIQEDLMRHLILDTLRRHRSKYTSKYGELVICCDARANWRREKFPEYKGKRKENRDKHPMDWDSLWKILEQLLVEIEENFPYKIIRVHSAEADDVIGELARYTQEFGQWEDIMIISADKDFAQLQKFKNVAQYSPMAKGLVKEKDPHKFLFEHVLRGDTGDGVPNFLSPDRCFIDGIRQTTLYQKRVDAIMGACKYRDTDALKEHLTEEELRNYFRNRTMIDLDETPESLKKEIINTFESKDPSKNKRKVFGYLIKHRCNKLLENVQEFTV